MDEEARAYGRVPSAMLAKRTVPGQLMRSGRTHGSGRRADALFIELVRDFDQGSPITDFDRVQLPQILEESAGLKLSMLTHRWIDQHRRTENP